MEESYGSRWNKPFHPDDKQRAWDAWQRATQHNEKYSLECRLQRADGVYRWWLIRGEPMRDENGEILKWFSNAVCLWVRDNGVGLKPDMDWRQSSSLGLHLVDILASQLRGTVETGTDPGTEFRVTFSLTGLQS